MKPVHLLSALAIAMLSVPSAWAQFGLYGAPELLRLPPVQQTSAEQAGQFGQVADAPEYGVCPVQGAFSCLNK